MKIILSIVIAFFILGCSDDSTKETKKVEVKVETKKEAVKEAKNIPVVKETPVVESKAEPKKEVIEVEDIKTEILTKKQQEITPVAVVKNDAGKSIYTKSCGSCHGQNGEKAALGKSKVIQGWSEDKVLNALQGYKNGTYGGSMKALMAGQAKMLSDDNAKIIAQHISTL